MRFPVKPRHAGRGKTRRITAWCRQNITGDDKGEAQIFLDRLFFQDGKGDFR